VGLFVALVSFFAGAGTAAVSAQVLPPPLRDSTARFRWSSYAQFRYTNLEGAEDLYGLRRLKVMMGGNLTSKIQWYAQGLFKDGNDSPTDGRVYFQEAWIRFAFRKEIQLAVGQFKPPFGRERFTPDFLILTIDRSLVTDALTPDGPYIDSFYRDRGFQLDGEIGRGLRYAASVFDGRGANHQFHGIGPMIVAQVVDELVRDRSFLGRGLTIQLGAAMAFRWGGDLPFRPCCSGNSWNGMEHFRGADRRAGLEFSADLGKSSPRRVSPRQPSIQVGLQAQLRSQRLVRAGCSFSLVEVAGRRQARGTRSE
jgi:hypothetical protein